MRRSTDCGPIWLDIAYLQLCVMRSCVLVYGLVGLSIGRIVCVVVCGYVVVGVVVC